MIWFCIHLNENFDFDFDFHGCENMIRSNLMCGIAMMIANQLNIVKFLCVWYWHLRTPVFIVVLTLGESNNKTVLLRDTVHQTSRRESAAADSPRDVWWTVSRNYIVLFLSRDVKNTKFNQYSTVFWRRFNVSASRFRKLAMFWIWRHHDMAMWRHGDGAWHNGLILTTASNANSRTVGNCNGNR